MDRVTITDATLREYGQNVPPAHLHLFTSSIRIAIAKKLIAAGFSSLEILSCVHPKIAPAMHPDAIKEITASLGRAEGFTIITLVPNKSGYRNFLKYGLGPDGYNHTMGVFFSAVEAHNLLNLGRSIEATMEEYKGMIKDALGRNVKMAGYISAAFGYLDQEKGLLIRPELEVLSSYIDFYAALGVPTVTLSDLQGVAESKETVQVFEALLERRKGRDLSHFGYHPHHVSGEKAIANSKAVYELGVRRFDASLGGTGGCVTGAPGNQPTEGLVQLFESMGVKTGVDQKKLSSLAAFVMGQLYSKIPLRKTARA